jgi:hypothetical protein
LELAEWVEFLGKYCDFGISTFHLAERGSDLVPQYRMGAAVFPELDSNEGRKILVPASQLRFSLTPFLA